MSESTWPELQPALACLADLTTANRLEKKKQLDRLLQSVAHSNEPDTRNVLWPELTKWTTSAIEAVREKTIALVQALLALYPALSAQAFDLAYGRLCGDGFVEPVEEVLLGWFALVVAVCKQSKVDINQALQLVQVAVADRNPDLQRQASDLLLVLAQHDPSQLALTGDKPMTLALALLSHKHTALRASALEAARVMGLAVPTRVSALNKDEIMALVFDTSPAVRARVCRVAGDLLTHTSDQHLGAAKPRFFALLLAGTFDPVDTVSQAAEEELQRLAEKYDKSRTMDKGLTRFTQTCYRSCFDAVMHDADHVSDERRVRVLQSLEKLLQFTDVRDLFPTLKALLDHIYVVYTGPSEEMKAKADAVLSQLGTKLTDAVYIGYLVPRLQQDEDVHAETLSQEGVSGMAITLQMLCQLLKSTTRATALDYQDIQPVLAALETDYFATCLQTSQALITATLDTLEILFASQSEQRGLPMRDVFRYQVILIGSRLRAASKRLTGGDAVYDRVQHMLTRLIRPTPDVADVYQHFLPTLLDGLRRRTAFSPKTDKSMGWTDATPDLAVLEVILDSVVVADALEDEGVPEQLVEILGQAGQHNKQEEDQRRVKTRCLRIWAQLFEADREAGHFRPYAKRLLRSLTPSLQFFAETDAEALVRIVAGGESMGAYAISLNRCIQNGIAYGVFKDGTAEFPPECQETLTKLQHACQGV